MRRTPRGCGPALAVVLVFSVHVAGVSAASGGDASVGGPIVFTQIPCGPEVEKQPGRAAGMLRCDYGDGGRIARLNPGGELQVLTAGFDSAGEPDVSFDGKRILFAGKRNRQDAWNIWEMNANGTGFRQVTKDTGNCRRPAYQSTLYTIVSTEPWYQIMFISDGAGEMNEFGSGPATSLYSCRLDGSAVRRLTMNLSNDMDPFLMDDGRVVLASWERADLRRGFRGRVALFGVNIDGADYALFCGDQGRRIKHMPCATTDGLAVFVEADQAGWDGAGQLACVTLRRNFYSHRRITNDGKFLYHSPSPLRDGSVLVSRRRADGSGTHGLYRLDPRTGDADPIFDDPKFHDIDARLLAPRPEPDGRSSVVDETRCDLGKLYCLNVYNTDPAVMPHMTPGLVRRLRVLEGVPLPAGDRSVYLPVPDDEKPGVEGPGSTVNGLPPIVQKRLLGEIAVEADGSFHIELPADVPVQLQTLDENGMALRTCGWLWVKHCEPRGCIGCHEDPELTPENRFVDALKKPGIKLMLPPAKRRTVDFRRDVMPIIAGKCATSDCHGAEDTPLNLSSERQGPFNRAYLNLLAGVGDPAGADSAVAGRYVDPGRARTSPLIWRLFGRNTSRRWDKSHKPGKTCMLMPPGPDAEALTDDEKLTLVEWVDLGAHWDGIPGANGPAASAGTLSGNHCRRAH